jgi:ABC-type protease/lipase transport system, ATPase and permease components
LPAIASARSGSQTAPLASQASQLPQGFRPISSEPFHDPAQSQRDAGCLDGLQTCFFNIGLFSAVINLLMLAPALYMLQVYDRVLASGNQMTLLMLTLMILGLFGLMGALEWVRSQVVIRLGTQMDMRLNQRVYDAAFEAQLRTGSPAAAQALNDLTSLRQFATGNALFAFSMRRGFRCICL